MISRIVGGLLVIVVVIAGMVVGVLLFLRMAPTSEQPNPYEYNVDEFRTVPAALVKYAETAQIKPDIEGLHGVAVDSDDRIYVAGRTAVAIFDKAAGPVGTIALAEPGLCVAVDARRNIYVGMTNHVEVFDAAGARQATWDSLGERALVTSIAIGSNDVFVADFGSRLVWRFDASGRLISRIGEKNLERGVYGFILPSPYFDVVADPDGTIWVSNPGCLRVEHFGLDGACLSFWGKAGMTPDGFCGCCNPSHLALLPDGKFVTSEKGLPRVKVCDRDGTLDCVVAGPNSFARGVVGLDLAVDSTGRVIVLDPSAGIVKIFQRKE